MQLEDVSVALRNREPWEAVDLGAVMLRAWWRPIYGALAATVVPITLVLHLLFVNSPWLALLLTWWLKPLYDRVILHIVARAVFGELPGVRQTLNALPRILSASALLPALTYRRFDIARAFNLGVYQLEGQRGSAAAARCQVLGRRAASQASGLLYACILFELVAMISLGAFVDLLTPATLESEYGLKALLDYLRGGDEAGWGTYLNHAFYVCALCAIEPLYVAGSFGLYLNRRTALEAWDIELDFRRMALAGRSAAAGARFAILMLLPLALLSATLPHESAAAEPEPREVIREILSAPEFQEYRNEKSWQRRVPDAPSASGDFSGLQRMLTYLSGIFADLMRIAAYVLLAVGLFFLLRYIARNMDRWSFARRRVDREPPRTLFGLDVRPEALPDNIAAVAAAAAESDPKLALSLLYRGALVTLMHRDRIELGAGDTEADCMRRVERGAIAPLREYFARLVGAWSQAAYAQRFPDRQTLGELCSQWPQHFGPGPLDA